MTFKRFVTFSSREDEETIRAWVPPFHSFNFNNVITTDDAREAILHRYIYGQYMVITAMSSSSLLHILNGECRNESDTCTCELCMMHTSHCASASSTPECSLEFVDSDASTLSYNGSIQDLFSSEVSDSASLTCESATESQDEHISHSDTDSSSHSVSILHYPRRRTTSILVKVSKLPLDFVNRRCYCVQLYLMIISLT